MVAEAWAENPEREPRTGTVADRFRMLGHADGSGAAGDPGPAGAAAPPVFGTAPWGYKRAEVDAWTSWVAGLVAHGRRETIRADSAEATLRATLERLEALQPRTAPSTDENRAAENRAAENRADRDRTDRNAHGGNAPDRHAPCGNAPEQNASDRHAPGGNAPEQNAPDRHVPDGNAPDRTAPDRSAPDRTAPGPEPARDRPEPERPTARPTTLPRRPARPTAVPDPAPAPDPETARLHVVETTLHEVMTLLHRLADPGRSGS